MLEIAPEARYSLSTDITIRSLPEMDRYYAFNIKTGDHFQLNATAQWVLEQIASGISYSELLNRFSVNFGVDLENSRQDLLEVIDCALGNKLIKEGAR